MRQPLDESLIKALQKVADLQEGTHAEAVWITPKQAKYLTKMCEKAKQPPRQRVNYDNMSARQKEELIKQAAERIAQTAHGTDPHNIPQHTPGAKLDAEKPRMGLVLIGFAKALTEVAKVGTYGARKYSDFGWLEVPDGQSRYTDAMLRHVFDGTVRDPESGLLHAAHAAWNALARLELALRKQHVTPPVAPSADVD
jgi:hypothetical protein